MYLIKILHQTTTYIRRKFSEHLLYLIEILHQTTTGNHSSFAVVSLYLIEILHQTTTIVAGIQFKLKLYLIEILHQTTTLLTLNLFTLCCILSKFYIKPQRNRRYFDRKNRCILSKFYIKPQRTTTATEAVACCILSKFYIKPQHCFDWFFLFRVVSYRNSTSNHNSARPASAPPVLYLIEILHQTTTPLRSVFSLLCCILSKFYIKPQPYKNYYANKQGCILSKFYIKPQRPAIPA